MAGPLDRHEHPLDRVLARREVGREPALVADGRRHPFLLEQLLQRVEDLDRDPEPLGERLRPARDDHELLEVERVVRVRAAVDDVQHRHRQDVRLRAADPAVERHACGRGGRLRSGERRAEDRVRAEARLVLGAVERDERGVDRALIGGVEPDQSRRDLRAHVVDRLPYALAEPRAGIAVAKLDRLELAGRGTRRHSGAPDLARVDLDLHLDRRVPSRVENLPRPNRSDLGAHRIASFAASK